MIQSVTFLAADLQVRLATGVFKDDFTPSLVEQRKHETYSRCYVCAAHGPPATPCTAWWYVSLLSRNHRNDRLLPSFYKLLRERPTALWHAWGATWASTISSGRPGPSRTFERDIEEMHRSRFYGVDPRTGREKTGL